MKIKLIAPARKPEWGENFWDLKTFVKLTGRKAAGTLLALPTLAALTPSDVEVTITDENVEPIDFNEKVDLVGISFLTSLAPRAYEIADEFRARGVKVVLGGIHASMLPNEAIEHADSVVIGEAEETWPKLIDDFKKDRLQKFYKMNCFPILEDSPIPRWDLLNTDDYCYFTIQTGRGCPYDCDFCSVQVFNGHKYRHKTIENVVKELEFLKHIEPKKLIFFADDNLLSKLSYTKELLEAIMPLNIQFWAQASINKLDNDEILELLYKAGCRSVFVGFESVSKNSLDRINKSKVNDVEKYKNVINKVHSSGIGIIGSFILGVDADENNVFQDTASFIKDNNIAFSMVNILTPFPGTRLFDKLKVANRVISCDWQRYNAEKVCFNPKIISKKELGEGRIRLLKQINSYSALSKSLANLWDKGSFLSNKKKSFPRITKGRLLFTLGTLSNRDFIRTGFVLKSLWNRKLTSVSAVTLALNCHDYTAALTKNILKQNDNKKSVTSKVPLVEKKHFTHV